MSAVYAEQDTNITNSRTALETELKKSGTAYQMTVYPGVGHGFHNDTSARYGAEQAQKGVDLDDRVVPEPSLAALRWYTRR